MGLRGPAKKMPALKALAGTNVRAEDKAQGASTQAPALAPIYDTISALPDPPVALGEHGMNMWRTVGAQLINVGLLQVVDVYALAHLCAAWQTFRHKLDNRLVPSSAEHNALRALLREFGLTPAARAGMATTFLADPGAQPKANRFERFKRLS